MEYNNDIIEQINSCLIALTVQSFLQARIQLLRSYLRGGGVHQNTNACGQRKKTVLSIQMFTRNFSKFIT